MEGPKEDSAREAEATQSSIGMSKLGRDPMVSVMEASLTRVSKGSEASASRQSDVGAPHLARCGHHVRSQLQQQHAPGLPNPPNAKWQRDCCDQAMRVVCWGL